MIWDGRRRLVQLSARLLTRIQEDIREEILMDKIARLIGEYEDPTGWCCSNNVGCIITIDQDAWQYNGEKFELMGTWTSADGGSQ